MPVGLASNGDQTYIYPPDCSEQHRGRLMETLSEVRAYGQRPLADFVYRVGRHLNRFNALTVVTSSVDLQLAASLNDLRRQGVEVAVVLVDRSSFGSTTDMRLPLEVLTANFIPTYLVRKGDVLNDVLRTPVKEMPRSRTTGVAGRQ